MSRTQPRRAGGSYSFGQILRRLLERRHELERPAEVRRRPRRGASCRSSRPSASGALAAASSSSSALLLGEVASPRACGRASSQHLAQVGHRVGAIVDRELAPADRRAGPARRVDRALADASRRAPDPSLRDRARALEGDRRRSRSRSPSCRSRPSRWSRVSRQPARSSRLRLVWISETSASGRRDPGRGRGRERRRQLGSAVSRSSAAIARSAASRRWLGARRRRCWRAWRRRRGTRGTASTLAAPTNRASTASSRVDHVERRPRRQRELRDRGGVDLAIGVERGEHEPAGVRRERRVREHGRLHRQARVAPRRPQIDHERDAAAPSRTRARRRSRPRSTRSPRSRGSSAFAHGSAALRRALLAGDREQRPQDQRAVHAPPDSTMATRRGSAADEVRCAAMSSRPPESARVHPRSHHRRAAGQGERAARGRQRSVSQRHRPRDRARRGARALRADAAARATARDRPRQGAKDKDAGITPIDGDVAPRRRPRDGQARLRQDRVRADPRHAPAISSSTSTSITSTPTTSRTCCRSSTPATSSPPRARRSGPSAASCRSSSTRLWIAHQVAAPAARQVARPHRRRAALPPALRRSRGQPRRPRGVPQALADRRAASARSSTRATSSRSRRR